MICLHRLTQRCWKVHKVGGTTKLKYYRISTSPFYLHIIVDHMECRYIFNKLDSIAHSMCDLAVLTASSLSLVKSLHSISEE